MTARPAQSVSAAVSVRLAPSLTGAGRPAQAAATVTAASPATGRTLPTLPAPVSPGAAQPRLPLYVQSLASASAAGPPRAASHATFLSLKPPTGEQLKGGSKGHIVKHAKRK